MPLQDQLQRAKDKGLHMVGSLSGRHAAFITFVSLYIWILPVTPTHLFLAVFGAACYWGMLIVQELGTCQGKQDAEEWLADNATANLQRSPARGAHPEARPALARAPRARHLVAEPQRKDTDTKPPRATDQDPSPEPLRAAARDHVSAKARAPKKAAAARSSQPLQEAAAAPGAVAAVAAVPRPEGRVQLCAGLAAARRAIDREVPPAAAPVCAPDAEVTPAAVPACQGKIEKQPPAAPAPAVATAEGDVLPPPAADGFEVAAVTKAAKRRKAALKKLNEASEDPRAKPVEPAAVATETSQEVPGMPPVLQELPASTRAEPAAAPPAPPVNTQPSVLRPATLPPAYTPVLQQIPQEKTGSVPTAMGVLPTPVTLPQESTVKCSGVYIYNPNADKHPIKLDALVSSPSPENLLAVAPPPAASRARCIELCSREDTCWVYLKTGYCPRGAACTWMHPPLPRRG